MKHLPIIESHTIPHKSQRYDTAGDYWKSKGMQFRISRMNPDYEFMVLIHELTEWYLTQKRGITIKEIDKFDMGIGKDLDDPGSDKRAPYYKEHKFATKIEKQLCKELGSDWKTYDQSFNKLKWK
jgi:hypothetical protein